MPEMLEYRKPDVRRSNLPFVSMISGMLSGPAACGFSFVVCWVLKENAGPIAFLFSFLIFQVMVLSLSVISSWRGGDAYRERQFSGIAMISVVIWTVILPGLFLYVLAHEA
jgi:hypothetical protein